MKPVRTVLLALFAIALTGCASPVTPPISASDWDQSLRATLERDVRTLAEDHPSRSILDPDRLEAAAAWLETRLAAMGYEVQSQPYTMPGPDNSTITVRNLFVEVPPTPAPDNSPARWLVIGAHYDTVRNTPGADDNASGVVGVLALAEYFKGRPQPVGLRFELYTNEETIRHGRRYMGSVRRARAAAEAGDEIIGAVILEMIGYYTGGPRRRRSADVRPGRRRRSPRDRPVPRRGQLGTRPPARSPRPSPARGAAPSACSWSSPPSANPWPPAPTTAPTSTRASPPSCSPTLQSSETRTTTGPKTASTHSTSSV